MNPLRSFRNPSFQLLFLPFCLLGFCSLCVPVNTFRKIQFKARVWKLFQTFWAAVVCPCFIASHLLVVQWLANVTSVLTLLGGCRFCLTMPTFRQLLGVVSVCDQKNV